MVRRTIAIVFVVAAFGVALYMSIRTWGPSASEGSSNQDEMLMVCEKCGFETKLSSQQFLDTEHDATGARKCPKCGAMRLLHAAGPCAKCGKHLPYDPSLTACPWCKAPIGGAPKSGS